MDQLYDSVRRRDIDEIKDILRLIHSVTLIPLKDGVEKSDYIEAVREEYKDPFGRFSRIQSFATAQSARLNMILGDSSFSNWRRGQNVHPCAAMECWRKRHPWVSVRNEEGMTAIDVAARSGYGDVLLFLQATSPPWPIHTVLSPSKYKGLHVGEYDAVLIMTRYDSVFGTSASAGCVELSIGLKDAVRDFVLFCSRSAYESSDGSEDLHKNVYVPIFEEAGISQNRVFAETWSCDTISAALVARQLVCKERGYKRIVVVDNSSSAMYTRLVFDWVFALPETTGSDDAMPGIDISYLVDTTTFDEDRASHCANDTARLLDSLIPLLQDVADVGRFTVVQRLKNIQDFENEMQTEHRGSLQAPDPYSPPEYSFSAQYQPPNIIGSELSTHSI